eukprot:2090960-Pyramimonas_sp.AAC.1
MFVPVLLLGGRLRVLQRPLLHAVCHAGGLHKPPHQVTGRDAISRDAEVGLVPLHRGDLQE